MLQNTFALQQYLNMKSKTISGRIMSEGVLACIPGESGISKTKDQGPRTKDVHWSWGMSLTKGHLEDSHPGGAK